MKLPDISLHWLTTGMGDHLYHDLPTSDVPGCTCGKRMHLRQIELQVHGAKHRKDDPRVSAVVLHYQYPDHPEREKTIEFYGTSYPQDGQKRNRK